VRRRSEESPRTDGGVPAPSSALSKRIAKQSCEVGTVRPHTADSEPREGALTTKARKGDRAKAGEIRHLSYSPVFVLDADGRLLVPCHPARARQLLGKGKADVEELVPFVIRLRRSVPGANVETADLKIDSGAKHVGFALMGGSGNVFLMGQLDLRADIKERMDWRRISRRSRRNRKTRYRKPRFDNRRRPEGWLPPSLNHRVEATAWLARMLARLLPVGRVVVETASFDMHRLLNPVVMGEGYQKGPLYRTDLRRYLFGKFRGKCAYCRKELGNGWQADHVIPKSRGGSDRLFNRAASCEKCNREKANRTADEFGHPDVGILALRDYAPAAIVNSIRAALVGKLSEIAPVVETDGVVTARNRRILGLEKTHANDAVALLDACERGVTLPSREAFFVARPCGTRRLVNGPHGGHAVRLARQVRGFRQWDVVQWRGLVCYVKGRRKTGSFLLSDVEGNKVKDGVAAKNLNLILRRRSIQGEMRTRLLPGLKSGVSTA